MSSQISPSTKRGRRTTAGSASSVFTTASSDFVSSTRSNSPTVTTDHTHDGVAVGLSDPANTASRKTMLQLINRLRDTGVQSDIDLPMIAVIGNQSAGKSSLIESISGITLPRSSGTCTRCPTECKLSHSYTPWKCLVKLHFNTDARGMPTPVKLVPFGGPITSHSLVQGRIRRAQLAILNPSKDPNKYLHLDDSDLPDESEVSFSKNYVSLEISGPELTDLSFVDLPGLIASVGSGGNEHDIELVKSLITTYIEKPSCVVLLTVACETDFENQGAHNLTKQHDPEGKRTVGVLTKPDRIEPGNEPSWLKILQNETEPLLNNWYCVKQPSQQDVSKGITWAEARRQEDQWFSSQQPWCSLESQYQKFLRTSYLTERLSLILSELIAKRLPKIQAELMNAIQETNTRLQALPKAPSTDPVGEVLHTLGSFVRDLERRVEGTPEEDGLLQTIRPHQSAFRLAIKRTAPIFVPWEKSKRPTTQLPQATFLASEEDDDSDSSVSQAPADKKIHVDEVFQRAQDARTRELPDIYPFVVQRCYIKHFTDQWSVPATILVEEVYMILKTDLANLVELHFERMGNGNARQAVMMIVNEHIDEAVERTKERIQWLLDLEGNPTTLNTHYYADYKDKFLAHYKAARDDSGLAIKLQRGGVYGSAVNKALSSLNEIGVQAKADDLPKLLPPDPMEAALHIMASVRAYFQVAYKRFTDMIPMAIDHEVVLGVKQGMLRALQDGLQITGPDGYGRCKSMLEERISIVSARQEIQEKLKRLQDARQQLRRLM